MRLAASLLVVAVLALVALASSGDRAQIYKDCVSSCHAQSCLHSLVSLPLPLRLTRWTCTDNCRYNCMHLITDIAIRNSQRIQQYHGKWPFWRYAGMQEPASVAFSLLNLLFHARGGLKVQRRVPDGHPMKRYYLGFAVVSVNAWVWSSVFHTRDLPITEKMDYFSAALAIVYALFYTVVRLFHLYPSRLSQGLSRSKVLTGWEVLCLLAFLGHVAYLTLLPRFDYTYNMAANLIVGMTHNVLWLLYSLPSTVPAIHRFQARPKSYRPPYASKAAIFVLLTTAATSLELFDFPPWNRIIDAHSLWHLATVPIAAFWYEFLIQDALDEGWRGPKPE